MNARDAYALDLRGLDKRQRRRILRRLGRDIPPQLSRRPADHTPPK